MKKTLFALMAFAIVVASCSKDDSSTPTPGPTPPPPGPVVDTTTFTGLITGVWTKTTFDGTKVKWSEGDSITINGIGYAGTPKAADAGVATFKKDSAIANPVKPYYAFFPTGIQTEGVKGVLPFEQKYSAGKFDNVPMFAHSDTTSLSFVNICGVIAVTVPPTEIDKVAAICLFSTEQSMSGAFSVVGDTLAVLTKEAQDTLAGVSLICEEPVEIKEPKTFYIAVPAQDYTNIVVALSSDGKSFTTGTLIWEEDPVSIGRGSIYSIDFEADEPTANCYIASSADTYSFKAVKGNSAEMVGDVAKVKVLWESVGTDTAPAAGSLISEVSYEKGIVTYTTKGTEGNAVIAAFDEDNYILWSWHIWCTDKPAEQKYFNDAGITMDRNLGAISADKADSILTFGLMYQWGRKDPFLGSCYKTQTIKSDSIPPRAKSVPEDCWETRIGPRTVDFTIAHPTSFVWSGVGFWSLSPDAYWGSEKTIYDPCPVGWRVPDGGIRGIWNYAAQGVAPAYDGANYGYDFKNYFTDASVCWYPGAGYIEGTTGNIAHEPESTQSAVEQMRGAYCWSCSTIPFVVITSWCLHASQTGFELFSTRHPRSRGLSVRCQKIEEDE